MAFNSNGQISYLVLDSLSSGAKYGLEIIDHISKKTNGSYILKKPTLYSCLTRMEKKGLVSSSFWGESELGGKRHYYSITDSGKENLEELSRLFANASYEVEKEQPLQSEQSPKVLHQGNIFDMVKEEKPAENETIEERESDVVENQIDIFNMEPIAPTRKDDAVFVEERLEVNSTPSAREEKSADEEKMAYYQNKLEQTPESYDGGIFLEESERIQTNDQLTPDQEAQNRRIYDTSSELKRYRKKKSFSENQIEMSVVYEDQDYEEIQRERIAELKKSLLNIKQNNFEEKVESPLLNTAPSTTTEATELVRQDLSNPTQSGLMFEKEYVEESVKPAPKNEENERIDDARLITEPRMNDTEIPIQRKITPPNIEVNIYDDNLPAPKRNSDLEPTYKDMMAKLFEKKKEKELKKAPIQEPAINQMEYSNTASFADYGSLKKYYQTHGISFKEYKKSTIERKHNTNLLNLICSAILLFLSGLGCAVLFGIISGTKNLKTGTNFMFYTLPILFLAVCIVEFCRYKFLKSKKATLFYNATVNWVVFVLGSLVVLVINILCKMQFETIGAYATSLFVPIYGLLLIFPINFHLRKFAYKKYSK